MTPAARVAAAIDCLDQILDGAPTERVLTSWARANRFAGSGDRAAIRDLVFDAVRRKRSAAAAGGGLTGRGLIIGLMRQQDRDLSTIFTGEGYAPAPLGADEGQSRDASLTERLDVQDWCWPHLERALGDRAEAVANALRDRAPVFLRVNVQKASRDEVATDLLKDGIETAPHTLSQTALEVLSGERRLRRHPMFEAGLFEFQDAASQAIVDMVGAELAGASILDFCAGGGGKALAMAAYAPARIDAHDANPPRMNDIPQRARRAGADINVLKGAPDRSDYDLVLVDAPCSGSGAWRRQPDAKWALVPARLEELTALQASILDRAKDHVRPGGHLVYATCSLFVDENGDQVRRFLDRCPDWRLEDDRSLTPLDGGDGFFGAILCAPD